MTVETPEELINDISRMIDELPSRAEYNRLKRALELIAELGGKTLLGPEWDTERQHELGAAKAFEQAADIARAALREPSADTIIAGTG